MSRPEKKSSRSGPYDDSHTQLLRSSLWNVIGQGLPLIAGVLTIPYVVAHLGTDRFGVLAIAWIFIGYFSMFDLGLGRALTRSAAEMIAAGKDAELPKMVWDAIFLMCLLGAVGGMIIYWSSAVIVQSILNTPQYLQHEVILAFRIIALAVPIVVITLGLRAVLEAYRRFDLVNILRIPMGLWTFIAPVLTLQFTSQIHVIVAVLVIGRIAALIAHYILSLRLVPRPTMQRSLDVRQYVPLIRYGGWMTVANIISPLMVYMDRFLIGAVLSMSAVAYYATPYEVITKVWLLPVALVSALFPAISSKFNQDRKKAANFLYLGIKTLFITVFPLCLLIITFSNEILSVWIDEDFAEQSTTVMQILGVGVFLNSLARMPFVFIQGAGRPDLIALTYVVELPFYLWAVWWLITGYNIEGAAFAWTARILVDMCIFTYITTRLLSNVAVTNLKYYIACGLCVGLLLLSMVFTAPSNKILWVTVTSCTFLYLAWQRLLSNSEKRQIILALARKTKQFTS